MPIDAFPDDIETLRALVVAAFTERDAAIAERDRALSQIDRLRHLLRQLSRAHFGKRSEKLDPDQLLRKRFSDTTLMLARATRQTSRLFGGKVLHI